MEAQRKSINSFHSSCTLLTTACVGGLHDSNCAQPIKGKAHKHTLLEAKMSSSCNVPQLWLQLCYHRYWLSKLQHPLLGCGIHRQYLLTLSVTSTDDPTARPWWWGLSGGGAGGTTASCRGAHLAFPVVKTAYAKRGWQAERQRAELERRREELQAVEAAWLSPAWSLLSPMPASCKAAREEALAKKMEEAGLKIWCWDG